MRKAAITTMVLATVLLSGCSFKIGTPGVGLAYEGEDYKGGTLVTVTQDKAIIGTFYLPF